MRRPTWVHSRLSCWPFFETFVIISTNLINPNKNTVIMVDMAFLLCIDSDVTKGELLNIRDLLIGQVVESLNPISDTERVILSDMVGELA